MIITPFALHMKQFIHSNKTLENSSHFQMKLNDNWELVTCFNLDNFIQSINLNIIYPIDILKYAKWIYEVYCSFYPNSNGFILVYSTFILEKGIFATIYPNKINTIPDEIYNIEIKDNRMIEIIKRYASSK